MGSINLTWWGRQARSQGSRLVQRSCSPGLNHGDGDGGDDDDGDDGDECGDGDGDVGVDGGVDGLPQIVV